MVHKNKGNRIFVLFFSFSLPNVAKNTHTLKLIISSSEKLVNLDVSKTSWIDSCVVVHHKYDTVQLIFHF